jgi:hypothetical protein
MTLTLFFIHLPYRSDPEPFPRRHFPLDQLDLEQEVERCHQQVVEHLREVRADYSLERRTFF